MRRARALTLPSVVGISATVVAAAVLLSHLPAAFRALNHEANDARGQNTLGGALSAADAVGLDERIVRNVFLHIPRGARYAVVLPTNQALVEKLYGVNPTTLAAVPTLLQNFLLPRRKVNAVVPGTYVVCFYCATSWHHRMNWIWDNQNGARVGYLPR